MDVTSVSSRQDCETLDANDELAGFRDRFELPEGVIYLDGNSLGARPKGAKERATEVIEREWGTDLIASWNVNGWFDLPVTIGNKISQLIGGAEGACVATDTTSINLFKALGAAVSIQAQKDDTRRVIISERDNFPTDLYMTEGFINLIDSGYELKLIDSEEELFEELGAQTAVVMLTHVNYRTGYLWDMKRVNERIHEAGALTIWDLCHSVGAVQVDLSSAKTDFAVGCTYKYLNGGPGSPAFIWVAQQHIGESWQPLSGWWGHKKPFEMAVSFEPADDIRKFLSGTQPIVSLAMMEVGIDVHLDAEMQKVREKSLAMTSLFISLVEQRLAGHPLTLITPLDEKNRGSHVSLRHPEGFAVMKALIERGVVGDYREPEVLRFGFTPLYLRFTDVWDAVETLREILDEKVWDAPQYKLRGAVT